MTVLIDIYLNIHMSNYNSSSTTNIYNQGQTFGSSCIYNLPPKKLKKEKDVKIAIKDFS